MDKNWDIIVIGGGAAGFFGAINIAESRPDLKLLILEKSTQVLTKVRISGGGRCNVTHACFEPETLINYYPRGSKELRGAFHRFHPSHTVGWFNQRGVKLKTEADGRMFPISDSSETIIECLLGHAKKLGIKIFTKVTVKKILKTPEQFVLELADGETLTTKLVLLASGGDRSSLAMAARLGHSVEEPVPSLFTFNVADARIKGLQGISVENVVLKMPDLKLEAKGPLLITHWGMSGPAVLKLSAWGARELHGSKYKARLTVNWLAGESASDALQMLETLRQKHPRQRAVTSSPDSRIPLRLWLQLAEAAGVQAQNNWADLSKVTMNRLVEELTQGEFWVSGKGQFKDEFVTCGGVALSEIDFKTMQSRKTTGLYFAGEVLNIDGLTGGFNFQNAWTGAWLAALDMMNLVID